MCTRFVQKPLCLQAHLLLDSDFTVGYVIIFLYNAGFIRDIIENSFKMGLSITYLWYFLLRKHIPFLKWSIHVSFSSWVNEKSRNKTHYLSIHLTPINLTTRYNYFSHQLTWTRETTIKILLHIGSQSSTSPQLNLIKPLMSEPAG